MDASHNILSNKDALKLLQFILHFSLSYCCFAFVQNVIIACIPLFNGIKVRFKSQSLLKRSRAHIRIRIENQSGEEQKR